LVLKFLVEIVPSQDYSTRQNENRENKHRATSFRVHGVTSRLQFKVTRSSYGVVFEVDHGPTIVA